MMELGQFIAWIYVFFWAAFLVIMFFYVLFTIPNIFDPELSSIDIERSMRSCVFGVAVAVIFVLLPYHLLRKKLFESGE